MARKMRGPTYEPDGTLSRVDVSTNHDGKITRVEHYEHDALVAAEEDDNGDGKMDKWETWEGDHLKTVAFDTMHRGTPDRRLVYGPNGTAQLEMDEKGTGQFLPVNPQSNPQSAIRNPK